jgi:hypothetical protein
MSYQNNIKINKLNVKLFSIIDTLYLKYTYFLLLTSRSKVVFNYYELFFNLIIHHLNSKRVYKIYNSFI